MHDKGNFKSGFIALVGKPNVGKSTLLNSILGEEISSVTPKAQTTRQRILGILNGKTYQMIFSDTPGIIHNPMSELHKIMNKNVFETKKDADILLLLFEAKRFNPNNWSQDFMNLRIPKAIILNKVDLSSQDEIKQEIKMYEHLMPDTPVFCISALHKVGLGPILDFVQKHLPVHPPFFEQEAITDRTERFIVSEYIREKIYLLYREEIPYSTEVEVHAYKDEEKICKIAAYIYVERESQKGILLGKGGKKIKHLGIEARRKIEKLIQKKVFLELQVKVSENWRNDKRKLKNLGY